MPYGELTPSYLPSAGYQAPNYGSVDPFMAVSEDPAERAAYRLASSQRPPLGRQEGAFTQGVEDYFLPKTPLDLGLLLATGPYGGLAPRVAALAAGAALQPSEAEAGPSSILGKIARSIRAYHGSPYDFERFDISKIGAGEGAQAYGHGLYFAENPVVAESYKNAMRVTDMDWPVVGGDPNWKVPAWVARGSQSSPQRLDEILADFRNRVKEARMDRPENVQGLENIVNALDAVKAGKAELKKPGHMYEVNIRADPEQFLNWDIPLSQQSPEVQSILANPERLGLKPAGPLGERGWYGYTDPQGRLIGSAKTGGTPAQPFNPAELGQSLYKGGGTWNPEEATAILREAGIPGIRYLDQGSRGGGAGTSNYVLFRDDIIDILRKYGLIGGAALPYGLAAWPSRENTAQNDMSM
jgi:hypothetical protein